MVARLMLNLRIGAERQSLPSAHQQCSTIVRPGAHFSGPRTAARRTFEDTIIGNLGAEVSLWDDDEDEMAAHDTSDDSEWRDDSELIQLADRFPYPAGKAA